MSDVQRLNSAAQEYWAARNSVLNVEADEVDPWVMNVILRVEKNAPPSHQDALNAAATGVALFFTDHRTLEDEVWKESIDQWLGRRIRKVARKTRGSKWALATSAPGITVTVGTATVHVAVPMPLLQSNTVFKGAQVSGLDLERSDNAVLHTQAPSLLVATTPDVQMSTGKQMAQVGHIAQFAVLDNSEWSKQWAETGCKVGIIDQWLENESNYSVQDAGLTEVPPGTLTAQGWRQA